MKDWERPASPHVLITGGAGDIGRTTAVRLARDGFTVHAIDRLRADDGRARLDEVAGAAGVDGRNISYHEADVTDREQMETVIDSIDVLDIAIANAGIVDSAPFLEITDAQWRAHLNVNLSGAFVTSQLVARRFVRDRTPGLLLFTGSWVGSVPWPEITAYTVTKAGIEMLARQVARELAPHGIRANVVAPGIVRAGLAKWQLDNEPQYAARAARVVPLGELQTAEQVAGAMAFLCSEDASYMTGATLLIDGGASLFAFD